MVLYIPTQQLLPWKISITIIHTLASLTTFLRFEHRRRTQKLWWDDRAAVIPAVVQLTINIAILWLRLRNDPTTPTGWKVFYSYMSSFCFGTIIWWSRIALGLTVIRITPSWSRCRKVAIAMTCSFFVFWISVILAMIVTCSVDNQWQHARTPILVCGPAHYVALVVVILDVIGDIALIGIPFRLLWSLRHPSSHRSHVLLVFSASTLTLLSTIVFCVASYAKFIVGPGRWTVWLLICHLTEDISMFTSNLLVLTCWFRHRFFHDRTSLDVDDLPQLAIDGAGRDPHGNMGLEIHFTRPSKSSEISLPVGVNTVDLLDTLGSSRDDQLDNRNDGILYQTQDTESTTWYPVEPKETETENSSK